MLLGQVEKLWRRAWAQYVERRVSFAQLAAATALRTWMGKRVACAALIMVKPSTGEEQSFRIQVCKKCQDANAALAEGEKGCRWRATDERAEILVLGRP
jgi:hypothetical protein